MGRCQTQYIFLFVLRVHKYILLEYSPCWFYDIYNFTDYFLGRCLLQLREKGGVGGQWVLQGSLDFQKNCHSSRKDGEGR